MQSSAGLQEAEAGHVTPPKTRPVPPAGTPGLWPALWHRPVLQELQLQEVQEVQEVAGMGSCGWLGWLCGAGRGSITCYLCLGLYSCPSLPLPCPDEVSQEAWSGGQHR